MYLNNDKISLSQLRIIFIIDLFGLGILILPRKVADIANGDGYMLIIGASILAIIYAYLVCSISNMFPKDTFVEYSQKIMSKYIGIALSIALLMYILIITGLQVRTFGEIVKQTLLTNTPIEFIIMSMLITSAYLCRKGYEVRGRLVQILVFVILIPIILIFILILNQVDFTNVLPIFITKYNDIISGSYEISLYYQIIILTLLIYPYAKNPKGINKVLYSAIITSSILYIFVVIITYSVFGENQIKKQIWPVMTMMQDISIPGSFIERQDALMMIFWISSVFILVSAGVYFITVILARLIHFKEQKSLVLLSIPFIYIVSLIPHNIVLTYKYIDIVSKYCVPFFAVIVPIVMIIVSKIRKIGDKYEE